MINDIKQGYRILEARRARKNSSGAKSKMSRALKTKLPRNQRNRKIKVCEKFDIKVPNSNREALIMDRMNNNMSGFYNQGDLYI